MYLKKNVKISNTNNLNDARYYAGMGAEIISFNFNENNPFYISIQLFEEITSWLPNAKIYGEFDDMEFQSITNITNQCEFSGIQTSSIENIEKLISLPFAIAYKFECNSSNKTLEKIEYLIQIKKKYPTIDLNIIIELKNLDDINQIINKLDIFQHLYLSFKEIKYYYEAIDKDFNCGLDLTSNHTNNNHKTELMQFLENIEIEL